MKKLCHCYHAKLLVCVVLIRALILWCTALIGNHTGLAICLSIIAFVKRCQLLQSYIMLFFYISLIALILTSILTLLLIHIYMCLALNGLFCADVPLRNTHSLTYSLFIYLSFWLSILPMLALESKTRWCKNKKWCEHYYRTRASLVFSMKCFWFYMFGF